MSKINEHDWKYTVVGGVTRVSIETGADIANLDQLDQKLWTVLSCPVKGLEFDAKSLALIDTDNDGRIHVNDITATSKWLCSILEDPDILTTKGDSIPLSAFDQSNVDGLRLCKSAKEVIKNLGLAKDDISIADISDSLAIFAKTRFNGDGIITENSSDIENEKKAIAACIASMGALTDRSGAPGTDADHINAFYAALADFAAWKQAADDSKASILPYGDNTEAALEAVNAVKAKIDDFFMRCRLAAFSQDSEKALDVSAERIGLISDRNLSECGTEIASYPLAHVSAKAELPLEDGINPAWQDAIAKIKSLIFSDKKSVSEAEWKAAQASFDAYKAWKGAKKGTEVEALGLDAIKELLADNCKEALLGLVAKDKELEAEAGALQEVEKLLYLRRDFFKLLRNFVTFSDFYSRDEENLAIFQAGKLYIDQRCCDLCIKVPDMGPHNTGASLSGMYIMYCNCVSKKGDAMTIAAVLTDGDVASLREGKHGIFYDRSGQDWDATITKIVDNPISIRQAFWSPYRKLGKFIEDTINKNAEEKDAKVFANLTAKATPAADGTQKQPFDIAKYAGIFAAVGVAVGAIGAAFAAVIKAVKGLVWWKWLVIIAVLLIVISGPAMIKAWLKLRKRNLSPLLNANGWAVNAKSLVNVRFGGTLTSMAKYPKIIAADPFADKNAGRKWAIGIFIVLAAAALTMYLLGVFEPKDKSEKAAEPAAAETVAEKPAAEESPATIDSMTQQ